MHSRSIDVSAKDEAEALSQGSHQLSTPVANLSISMLSEGKYRLTLIRADAEVEIKISKDGMNATVDQYLSPTGGAPSLTLEKLHASLAEAGVIFGIDEDVLASIVEDAQNDKSIRGRVLAKGKAVEKPGDASVYQTGNPRHPVLPGMIICRKSVLSEGAAGMNLSGTEIPLLSGIKAKDIVMTSRGGAEVIEYGTVAVATIYGLGVIDNGQVEVTPLFTVANDALSVTATLYPTDSDDNEITTERIIEALEQQGLVSGADTAMIDATLCRIREGSESPDNMAENVVVMTSQPAVDGADGRLVMSVDDEKVSGIMDKKGNVDYHERSTFRCVNKGDELARIVPPTAGTAGVDVRGGVIPAAGGQEVSLQIGENVVASDSGRTLIAGIDGVVVHAGDHISVTDVLEIKGDVNYESGNVHLEKGSVLIKGGIRTGFEVDVPGNIVVEDGIEGAEVKAGGDIEVKRGLLMHNKGRIAARGSISAHFAENATIEADKDINISNNISNCHIVAGGKISVTKGKGVIVGGDICSNGGVEANEIGSELGVETHITIGVDSKEKQEFIRKKQGLQESISKIDFVIGDGDFKSIIMNAHPSKRMALGELIKAKIGTTENISKIDERLEVIAQEEMSREKSTIVVQKTLHPGVHLLICGQHLEVKKPISHCCVRYDPDGNNLRVVSIDAT